MKDKGMKWVIVADVMAIIVVGLLLWASYIDREVERQQLEAQAETQLGQDKPAPKSYDFDLQLTPQNCEGVDGTVDAALITDANYMDLRGWRLIRQSKPNARAASTTFML